MKKSLMLILLVSGFISAQTTPLQLSGYEIITPYAELSKFVKESADSSRLIKYEVIGLSAEGRELYAVYISNGEFGKDDSKIKVLIFAQQHGNEQSGKEGALLLISELNKPEYGYLFDKIDLALVPQMNPDGSEVNQRRNANNADLNRNHLILTEPETIALHKLFDKYLFEVTMDVHEYYPYGETYKKYGYRNNADEELGTLTNINVSPDIRELSKNIYVPYIKNYFNERNYSFFVYSPGGPPEINYIRNSTFDINDGRQSLGIQNTFSLIQEGMNGEDNFKMNIKRRAEGQMTGMIGLIEFAYLHKDELKNLVTREREKLINNTVDDTVAIQLDHFADGTKLQLPLLSYSTNKDTIITVNDYRPVVKSLTDVIRPKGYLIPKEQKELVAWADRHNLTYGAFPANGNDKIERYFVSRIDSIDFEGDIIIDPVVELTEMEDTFVPEDYFFIPVSQLKNNLIVIALEPKSELALITYKNFEHLLKKGDYYPVLRVAEK